jgi:hypothetical protein
VACIPIDDGSNTLYCPRHLRGLHMSDVFDDLIDRQAPTRDPAHIAAVIASDPRFAYFGTAAFTVRLMRLEKAAR